MKVKPVRVMKFNYTINQPMQKYTQFSSMIEIDEDNNEFVILNIRKNEKYN